MTEIKRSFPARQITEQRPALRGAALHQAETLFHGMPFDTTKTGIPFYDMMLKNPEYFRKNKGLVGKAVYMSPDEYITLAAKCLGTTPERFARVVDEGFIRRYANSMWMGTKFDMPVIECHRGYTEGRHRALAAKKIGVTKIPVFVVEKVKENELTVKENTYQPTNLPTYMTNPYGKNDTLYHGTSTEFTKFNRVYIGKGVGGLLEGSGVYLTDKLWAAEYFARDATIATGAPGTGVVLEAKLKPRLKILDLDRDRIDPAIGRSLLEKAGLRPDTIAYTSDKDLSNPKAIVDFARYGKNAEFTRRGLLMMFKDLGYDGVRFDEIGSEEFRLAPVKARTTMIFNPANVEFQKLKERQPVVREAAPKTVFKRAGKLEIHPLLVQAFGITSEEIIETINASEEPEAMRDMFAFLSDYAALSDPRTRMLISGDKLDFMVADMKRRMGRVAEVYSRQAEEHREFGYATASLLARTSDKARELSNFRGMSRKDKIAFIDEIAHLEHTSGSIIPIAFGISDYGREDYWPRKLLAFLRTHGMPGMVKEGGISMIREATTPETADKEFKANPNLINKELAMRSHSGTSWDPEKRGIQEIAEFVSYVQDVYDRLSKHAKTDKQKEYLLTEMGRFQSTFASKYNDKLSAQGSCMSTMIAGPSKFPTGRAQKACSAADKRYEELIEFRDRAEAAILRELKKMGVEEAGGEVAVLRNKIAQAEKLQEMMVEANKIIRKKAEPGIGGVSKLQQLVNLGFTERQAAEALKPDFAGRLGFPSYALTNNNANIRRMKERIGELEKKEATPSGDIAFEGGTIHDSKEDDRIQIFFDQKPAQEIINRLKSEGWHWSPSIGAWQRKRTDMALFSARRILGLEAQKPVFVPAKEEPKIDEEVHARIQKVIDIMKIYRDKGATYEDFLAGLKGYYLEQSGYVMGSNINVQKLIDDLKKSGYINLRELWRKIIVQAQEIPAAIPPKHVPMLYPALLPAPAPVVVTVPAEQAPQRVTWRKFPDHKSETKAVKDALENAGIKAEVGHGTGTSWGWLEINIGDPRMRGGLKAPPLQYQYTDEEMALQKKVLKIAQDVTGRRGEYDGKISILAQEWRHKPAAAPSVVAPQPQAVPTEPAYIPQVGDMVRVKKTWGSLTTEDVLEVIEVNELFDAQLIKRISPREIVKYGWTRATNLIPVKRVEEVQAGAAPSPAALDNVIALMEQYMRGRMTYEDFVAGLKGYYLPQSGYQVNNHLDAERLSADLKKAGYNTLSELWNDTSRKLRMRMYVPPKRPQMLYPAPEVTPPRPAEEIMFVPNPETLTMDEYIREKFRRLAQVLRQQGKIQLAGRAELATDPEYRAKFAGSHRDQVVLALAQGKPVSPVVLKDYPDIVARVRQENEAIIAKEKAERERIKAIERIEENELNAELNKLPPPLKRHAETEIYGTLHLPETHKDYRNRFYIALGKVRRIAFAHLLPEVRKEEPVEPLSPEYERVLKAYLEGRGYELKLQDFIWADKYTIRGTAKYAIRTMEEKRRREEFILKNYNEDIGKKFHRGTVVSALNRGLKVPDEVLREYPDLMKKEPWEMTQEEYWRAGAGGKAFEGRGTSDYNHKQAVYKAISEGKPVSAKVLKDYPDLMKKEVPAPAAKPVYGKFVQTTFQVQERMRRYGYA